MLKSSSVVVGHYGSGDGPLKPSLSIFKGAVGAPLTDWPCDRPLAPRVSKLELWVCAG